MRRCSLLLVLLAVWLAATIQPASTLPAVEQAAFAYDADSVRVVSYNVLTCSEASGQSGPSFGLFAKIVAAKSEVTVFRQGTFADEAIGWEGNAVKGKQWATDNPLTTPDYAKRYGLPAENTGKPDWVVGGRTQGPYTTRPAPASHNFPANTGGATEVLPQNPNNVILDWFHMP